MPIIYIAGIRPGVGSTTVTAGMVQAWRSAGRTVQAAKPLASDSDSRDAALLGDLGTHASAKGNGDPVSRNREFTPEVKRIINLARDSEIVIVDGLPLTDESGSNTGSAEFAAALGATVIGVTDAGNEQQSASLANAFQASLIGCIENRVAAYGSSQGIGHIPEDRTLLAPSVGQLESVLGATLWAGFDSRDALVEHFLIGALVTEWGGNYFGRLNNQGVIVRGGRIDIQMSALNFPLACLVLTGTATPSQYVLQRAKSLEAPLMVTQMNTQQAAATAGTLIGVGKIHCMEKVERAAALVGPAFDWEQIETAVGL